MSFVISTAHLSKKFLSSEAVDDLNLEVPEASIFGYLGPNGAGKTTTIKTLMNIDVPTGTPLSATRWRNSSTFPASDSSSNSRVACG